MAIKKSQLYSKLWEACDELRGGMDASQYKDYVLVVLFIKYLSDKKKSGDTSLLIELPEGCSFDDLVLLKGSKDIGEKMNVVLSRIAQANDLEGVVNNADFADEAKLGKGKDLVDTVSGLIGVFQDDDLDFSNNRAADDDLIGDASPGAFTWGSSVFANANAGFAGMSTNSSAMPATAVAAASDASANDRRALFICRPLRAWVRRRRGSRPCCSIRQDGAPRPCSRCGRSCAWHTRNRP